jgi:hypothetical protein
MQFGKFHGIALLALGILLLFVQAYVIFEGRTDLGRVNPPDQATQTEPGAATTSNAIDYLPGAMGIGLVALGGFVLMLGQRQRPEQVERREEHNVHPSPQRLEKHG